MGESRNGLGRGRFKGRVAVKVMVTGDTEEGNRIGGVTTKEHEEGCTYRSERGCR